MKQSIAVALLTVSIFAAAPAWAAPTVTLVLTSGEKVRCELVDLGGVGFTVRVNGADRQIPAADVAVIDFTGAPFRPAELERVRQGQAIAVFHSGDVFEGRLADIGGTDPLRMTFSTNGGTRDVSSNELSRVYLSRWQGMPGTGAVTQPGEAPNLDQGGAGLTVPANPCWTNTVRSVRQGQRVTFVGTGEIQLSADANDIAGVAGARNGRLSAAAPIPGALVGALIGRIGNGRPFGIGDQVVPLTMPASGQLWLGINDDHCADNRGQFKVEISVRR
jgi:hypothetical protein